MDAVKLKKGLRIAGEIERINAKELSYTEFVKNYLVKNQPVILTGLMDDWQACKDWVSDDGEPNLAFFSTNFGKSQVQDGTIVIPPNISQDPKMYVVSVRQKILYNSADMTQWDIVFAS